MSNLLRTASCWVMLWATLSLAAEPSQTGPVTEKRFPPLRVPPGFHATLFACDPLIEYPSAIALGPRAGTLFVAVDYMTGLGTEIIKRDEIRLVEDSDGDGYADRAPVWADGFNFLTDKWPEVRLAAAFAAGQLNVRDAIPTLLNRARLDDPEVRRACFDALRQLREPRVVPLAAAALSDAATQLSALRCLAELGGPEHAPAVIEIAARNSSTEVLSLTVEMLTKWSTREGLDPARRADLDRAVAELQGTSGLLAWHLIGPLPSDEAARMVESVATVAKPAGKSVATDGWKTVFGSGPESRVRNVGQVSNLPGTQGQVENLPHDKNRVWLAYADFQSSEPTAAQFLMSSNGTLQVRLNGRSVLERAEPRRFQPDADRFDAELTQGTNRLLVQIAGLPDAALEFHARIRRKSSKAEHYNRNPIESRLRPACPGGTND